MKSIKKLALRASFVTVLMFGAQSCATMSMLGTENDGDHSEEDWAAAKILLLPFTLVWDIVTLPIQVAMGVPPYGDNEV